jgi:tartrate dehydratase alpha subunit/fumarate hydratase class I-like protein
MREIDSSQIQEAVKKLAIEAAYDLEPDILNSLKAALFFLL